MTEIFTMILALLAAFGVVALLWLSWGALLRGGAELPATVVLRPTDRPVDMRRALRRLQYLRQWGLADLRILLIDDGMTGEIKKQVELLMRDDPDLSVCAPSEVTDLIGNANGSNLPVDA